MSDIKFYSEPVEMDYIRSPGKLLVKFFASLRDEGVIKGIRCSHCSHTFVPPQQFCPDCFHKMSNFVAMPATGQIASYTVVKRDAPFAVWKAPFAYVAVKFDGSDSLLWHRLKDTANIAIGARVRAVFRPASQREGSLLDIEFFEMV